MSEYERVGACNKCGRCCAELKIKLNERIDGALMDYFHTRGVLVEREFRHTILTIPYRCPKLNQDNTCRLEYTGRKPLVCYLWPEKHWQVREGCGFMLKPIEGKK